MIVFIDANEFNSKSKLAWKHSTPKI